MLLGASALAFLSGARADVSVFADSYKTNTTSLNGPANNAAHYLLQGYGQIWTTGTSWNNGSDTGLASAVPGKSVMELSQSYVVAVTQNRTAQQEVDAYLTDRQAGNYRMFRGLGDLESAWNSAAGTWTSLPGIPAGATTGLYGDVGSGSGNSSSPLVGKIISLTGTLRSTYSSTTPAKNYFNSPRPWLLNDNNQVVVLGTETTGYYTSTKTDGTPDTSKPLTFYPAYETSVVVAPSLLPRRGTTPETDGGFNSGHTNASYLAGFAMGYAMPEKFQSLLLTASANGEDRIIAGLHSPLDVIGGRMLATALSAAILNDPANAVLKSQARAQGADFVAANQTPGPADRFAQRTADVSPQHDADKALFTARMSYGLQTLDNSLPVSVPKAAEVPLETRLPYLDASQRREVLRTTAIGAGNVLTDDPEGWGRLNYFAAADGFGRFENDVVVTMNASLGGFHARDVWRNNISGNGTLTKLGTGELALSGNNSFAGNVTISGGTLVAEKRNALGGGSVTVGDAALVINSGRETAQIVGALTVSPTGTLELSMSEGLALPALSVNLNAALDGHLKVVFQDGFFNSPVENFEIPLLDLLGGYAGSFSSVEVLGLGSGGTYDLNYTASGVGLNVSAVPEPQTWCLLGLGAFAIALRLRSRVRRV